MRRDAVRLALDRVGALDERDDLVRNAAVQRDVLLEQREHAARDDVQVRRIVRVRRVDFVGERGAQVARRRHVARDASARDALDEDARRSVCLPRRLDDPRDDADAMQVAGRRLLDVGAALRDEEEQPVLRRGRLDGAERRLAADEQRHRDVGKDDDVAKRENGEHGEGREAAMLEDSTGRRTKRPAQMRGPLSSG